MKINEDVMIPTMCIRCYANCGIRVRRVNGVAVEAEGEPGSDLGARGGLCAKGIAGLHAFYDPNRLNVPLKRTNPEKRLGVDPIWEEISWDEAFDTTGEVLGHILKENPVKVLLRLSILRTFYSGFSIKPREEPACVDVCPTGARRWHCHGGLCEPLNSVKGQCLESKKIRRIRPLPFFDRFGSHPGHEGMCNESGQVFTYAPFKQNRKLHKG